MLGHDSHGHAEQTGNGCTGFLQTIASDVSHGGNVFGVISAHLHRQGRLRRPGAVADRLGQSRSARSTRRSSSSSTSPARATATNTDTTGQNGAVHRSGIGQRRLAAAQRADQPVPDRLDRVPLRRRARRVARPARRWPAIDLRQDSITGPVIATANLTSTGGTGVWATTTVPLVERRRGRARAVPDVPHRHGRRDRRQPVQPQLGGVRRQRRDGPVDERRRAMPVAPCRRPSALTPGHAGRRSGRSPRASPAPTPRRRRPTSSRPPATRRSASPTRARPRPGTSSTGRSRCRRPSRPRRPARSAPAARSRTWAARPPRPRLLTYDGPVSNDPVAIAFSQAIGATDALRTGAYSKTLTFTLSTTTP